MFGTSVVRLKQLWCEESVDSIDEIGAIVLSLSATMFTIQTLVLFLSAWAQSAGGLEIEFDHVWGARGFYAVFAVETNERGYDIVDLFSAGEKIRWHLVHSTEASSSLGSWKLGNFVICNSLLKFSKKQLSGVCKWVSALVPACGCSLSAVWCAPVVVVTPVRETRGA